MELNNILTMNRPAYAAKALVGSKVDPGLLPADRFQSVLSNPSPVVNIKDAMYLLFGGENPVETLWKIEPDGFGFLNRGNYLGPAPLMNSTSIFKGDQTTYRRINQVSGQPEWEFKLGKDEKFINCKPVLTKENLLGLLYEHPDGVRPKETGLLVIDTRNGKEVFRTPGSDYLYNGIHTDGQGNLYCATTIGQKVLRVSPSGDMKVLGEFGNDSNRYLCEIMVTSDGTVYYPHTNDNKMVRLKNGRERVSAVEGKIDKFHPLDNGMVITVSRMYPDPTCRSMVTCLGKLGKPLWKKPLQEDFVRMTVSPDGSVFLLHNRSPRNGDTNPQPTYIDCTTPDGKTAWTYSIDSPDLNDDDSWFDCSMRVGPSGDLLVMAEKESKVICIGPDGKEKWHFAPPLWVSYGTQYSITKDEKMFVLHNGSMARLDLATGKTELKYERSDDTLTRYRDGAEPEVTRLNSKDALHFQGIVLERDDHHLFTFDEEGRFCALELPMPGKKTEEGDDAIHAGSAADKVEVIDDYIVIDGVMLPINKNNSPA